MNRKKVSRILYVAWLIECLIMMYYWVYVMGYGVFDIHMNPYAGLSALNGILMGMFIAINCFSLDD